jgi:hypothetical protein
MKTDNRDSEKDLNANPESRLNTNRPLPDPDQDAERFPESNVMREELEDSAVEEEKDDSDIESLANDTGTVGERTTGSSPNDIAGVADLDRGMRRAKRRS